MAEKLVGLVLADKLHGRVKYTKLMKWMLTIAFCLLSSAIIVVQLVWSDWI